jgi:integrase
LTASTLADNRKKIDRIIGQWGDKPLAALTVEEVGNYLFSLKLSGSWKRHFLAVLREVYAEAVWYKENLPCPHFPKFARNHRKADILTVEEVEKLFVAENFPSRETYLLFLCAVYGGLRIGEAAGLRPKQFVYEYKALVVDGFCRMNGERMRYNKKGTEEHPRTRAVPLPERVLEQMKEHIREEGIGEEEFCFRAEKDRGRAIRIPAAGKAFRVALKASGIEAGGRKLVPHSLRYTYVTKLLKKLPIEVVRKLAGHLSEGMTEYYNKRELDRTLKGLEGAGTAVSSLYT